MLDGLVCTNSTRTAARNLCTLSHSTAAERKRTVRGLERNPAADVRIIDLSFHKIRPAPRRTFNSMIHDVLSTFWADRAQSAGVGWGCI